MVDANGQLNEFGATVLSLMAEKGLTQLKELSEQLALEDEQVSPSRLSNWFHGRNAAPPRIPRAIAKALKLDDERKQRLANAYAYGQDVPVGNLN